MGRFLVDVPADDVRKLDEIARREGKSRAAVLREAVAHYLAASSEEGFEKYFGLWARNGIAISPQDYDRQRRAEWARPWDDDFDEIRAESPEYFSEEDERERAHYLALSNNVAAKPKPKTV